ncbi:Putative ABC transporter [Komagataella phaffii CBS 7435]|uniref:ABC transporter n=2 Tax=Komagataella phaffii TaxID=460519 RepID=C4QZX4_KOMPG|nr:Putative ABC transporter [Komagataella phaffii GS115]AOA63141.1 GQ67_00218T0 [Komagataella phaffii]CAH2448702.1 Putative ABC transporter [Komagataella phaffii CBS 7435]AOA66957.1 GQ68_01170T0 [Komagataella phaffii GS115]CAY68798.1 Putative ABC transporter [Komagataella phaffii GS115]SCV12105.1 Putative ABC transporter [Komagataella phaffii CBS 7435]
MKENDTPRVGISVRDLAVVTKKSRRAFFSSSSKRNDVPTSKVLLEATSFDIEPGTITAIMGGSGSGKTTMLNCLANGNENSGNINIQGTIAYNGKTNINTISHAYVIQQDILLPNLTCYETLMYSAELRLKEPKEKLVEIVDQVILELGLKDCRNTLVGNDTHKGLSGGEKRRLSIGIQMLCNPSVLFLDEPTTGLDAYSALLLIQTLKNLANQGKTFVLSIHQPRSDIFFLFDNLILLSRGKTCYSGPLDKVIPYFEQIGYHVPKQVNPADYFIEIVSINMKDQETENKCWESLSKISDHWKDSHDFEPISVDPTFVSKVKSPVSFSKKIKILTRRDMLLSFRSPLILLSLLIETIAVSLICGWVFFIPGSSLRGIRTMTGALYTTNGLQPYLFLLFEVYRLSSVDIKIYDRERSEGVVSAPSFLISRRISKFFTEDVWIPILESIIGYFMFGLRTDSPRHFFIYFAAVYIAHLVSMCFAMACVSISREYALASLMANLNFTLQSMACGYLANSRVIPVYVRWTKYIAYLWYGYGAVISNQFTGFRGECFQDTSQPNIDEVCAAYYGNNIIRNLGFWPNFIALPLCVEVAMAFGFYLFAGLMLTYKTKSRSALSQEVSSSSKRKSLKSSTQDATKEAEVLVRDGLTITLKDASLKVRVRKVLERTSTEKEILHGVNAEFKPGQLNTIMGPSGSGKSSLLNLISGRLHSNVTTSYTSIGDIFLDSQLASFQDMDEICSYVSQDGDHLIPSLSVRETLLFAARLRLNLERHQVEKRVDEIILKMGLRDVATVLVGSEFVKGISGGERKRLSIAIQLINDPPILLLDEPTSGLDAFTAGSILKVLQTLCDENKTVVLTIHQPRLDLFHSLGSILLLAKGGHVAFKGTPNEMLEHFESMGYPCPAFVNAADHVLDVISVNVQNEINETISRKRVNLFLDEWKSRDNQETKLLAVNTFSMEDVAIKKRSSFMKGYTILLQRQALCIRRDTNILFGRIAQIAGLGIILALFYSPLKHDYTSIQQRLGALQQMTALYFIGMLNNIMIFPLERTSFYTEYKDKVVSAESFFMAYLTLELPFELVSGAFFSVFMVMVIGFPRTPGLFFAMYYASICIVNCGESLGVIFNVIFDEVGFAVNIISIFLSIATFMTGVMSLNMGAFLRGINWLSPLYYAVMGVLNLAFPPSLRLTCEDDFRNPDGSCIFSNGTDVLEIYQLKKNWQLLLGLLIVVVFVYRGIGYVMLKLKVRGF